MGIGPIELLRAQRLSAFTRRCWPAIKSQPHPLLWWEHRSALWFSQPRALAAAYQEQYGQSPSQTLNQAA